MFVFPFMLRSTHEKLVGTLAGEIFYLQKKLKEKEMPKKKPVAPPMKKDNKKKKK